MGCILKAIQKHKLAYALLFVVVYQIASAMQGFDLSDEGWGMYFYQQIFKNPECVAAQMPYWFTGVIGGAWNLLFPMGGFLGTRLLGIMIITGTFYLSYIFLKKSINSGWLLVGLIAQVLIVVGDPKPYGYNSLTAFFVLLSVMSLWRGLESHKLGWLFLSGLLLGINVFVRIPNIAILPIILLIPCYIYWKESAIRIFSYQMWVTGLGIIVGFTLVVSAMYYWGYWPLFMEALGGVADSATDVNNSHQLGRMLTQYAKNYSNIISVGGIIILLGGGYVWLRKKYSNKFFIWIWGLAVAAILIFLSLRFNNDLRNYDMYFVQFISYAGVIVVLLNNENLRLRYAALASLLMIVCMPLGSDQGINTMWTSAWLALPLATAYLYSCFGDKVLWKGKLEKYSFSKDCIRSYFCILFVVFIGCGIYKNERLAYYDPGSRLEKIHSINNPYCRFIYTNSYRTNLLNELLPALEQYVKSEDYLLVYNFMPGINYMTNTRSYLPNSWLWAYSGAELEQQLNIAVSKKKILPVVLRQHFIAANRWWDYDPCYTDANRKPANPLSRPDQTKAINDFLSKYHYKTAWTNKHFEILLPEEVVLE